eukprot:5048090-Karenia_brevis.AAC.1
MFRSKVRSTLGVLKPLCFKVGGLRRSETKIATAGFKLSHKEKTLEASGVGCTRWGCSCCRLASCGRSGPSSGPESLADSRSVRAVGWPPAGGPGLQATPRQDN